MPNGTPRRVMDNSQLFGLKWRPKIQFPEGIYQTIKWYENDSNI
jgi:GDP-L-fucose synthase